MTNQKVAFLRWFAKNLLLPSCVSLQRRGVRIVSAEPRFVLNQLHVAAASTHDLGHQDVGTGAADTSMMTSQTLTNLYTHTHNIHTWSYLHTLTQSVAAFQPVCSCLEPWLDIEGSDEQTLTQKGHFNLVFLQKNFKSVCCCIDVFFYQSFCHCWMQRSYLYISLSLSFLLQLSADALTFGLKELCNL